MNIPKLYFSSFNERMLESEVNMLVEKEKTDDDFKKAADDLKRYSPTKA